MIGLKEQLDSSLLVVYAKKKLSAPGKQLLRKDVKFTFYFNEAKAAS
ncbi:hypothetical protein AQPE_2332 [Aquipluma nitroreducens]|uniref:Uncharacterized protein n=1 Tax=Aquipluma nitroreducens TaxID=2010828 RepID=A0A5K7S9D6_9BACT|nr:hypothetical protein AQPE_2332 [Aquipluma nitroreducens]